MQLALILTDPKNPFQELQMKPVSRRLAVAAAWACAMFASHSAAFAEDIKIGLVAALTGQSAQSGEAITRGLTIAIDEINAHIIERQALGFMDGNRPGMGEWNLLERTDHLA